MTTAGKVIRCAIYTRVSTDAGLDQEFNSLDAQYDAASAYIRRGKRTVNFAKFAWWARFSTLTRQQIQRLAVKFPTQQNREFLQKNREFARANREFEPACRAISELMFSEGLGHSSA